MRIHHKKLPPKIRRAFGNGIFGVVYGASLTETFTPVDLTVLDLAISPVLAESASSLDAFTESISFVTTLTEDISPSDIWGVLGDLSLTLTETVTGTAEVRTAFVAAPLGAFQVYQDRTGTSALASGLTLTTGGIPPALEVYATTLVAGNAMAEALTPEDTSSGSLDVALVLAETTSPVDTVDTVPEVIDYLVDAATVSDSFTESVDYFVALVETVAVVDEVEVTAPAAVYEVSLDETVTVSDDFAADAGILPEPVLPPAHFGGIGGLSRTERQLHALAQGADLTIALVLEPGRAYAAAGAVAQGANLALVSVGTKPRAATVLGDSLGVTITLDAGVAFGVVDWNRYNEELLLLVA